MSRSGATDEQLAAAPAPAPTPSPTQTIARPRKRRPALHLGSWLLLLIVTIVFAAFLLWPIYQVVRVAFFGVPNTSEAGTLTLGYFREIALDPALREGIFNSACIAICVTIIATLISIPLALLSVRYDFRGKGLLSGLLLVPLILPPFVGAIGMRQILGRFGALTGIVQSLGLVAPNSPVDWIGYARVWGVIVVEALSLYPILFL